MENMDKLFTVPWLIWVIVAVAMIVTVFSTEYFKPLIVKWSDKRKAKGKSGIKIPPLLLFWIIGIVLFAGMSFIDWIKFSPPLVVVYIVFGGALNAAYYNDFLKMKTIVRKLILGEVPIPGPDEK
ncbi:MAG: hypothetical protein WC347_01000 [Smithellaceae bacterium]|jgi:hypothetical protein